MLAPWKYPQGFYLVTNKRNTLTDTYKKISGAGIEPRPAVCKADALSTRPEYLMKLFCY